MPGVVVGEQDREGLCLHGTDILAGETDNKQANKLKEMSYRGVRE